MTGISRSLALVYVTSFVTIIAACSEQAPRSLQNEASIFKIDQSIAPSTFAIAGIGGGMTTNSLESSFSESTGALSVLRANEVPSELREKTAELLTTLNAKQTSAEEIVFNLPADVLFDFDKAVLRSDALESMKQAAELIGSYPDAPIVINGHTDSKGTNAYNTPLSLRRAQAVGEWLRNKTGRNFTTNGLSSQQPVASNNKPDGSDDPDGRQRNRRVEIIIKPVSN